VPLSRSLHVHDNGLLVRARLFAQAGILDAAVAKVRRDDEILVDLDEAGSEPLCAIEGRFQIARPNRRRQPVFTVVGAFDRLFIGLELDDACDRSKDLFASQPRVVLSRR
jgi:hypothetical protein